MKTNSTLLTRHNVNEPDDSRVGRSAKNCQFAKIFVEGDENASVSVSPRQNLVISWINRPIANPFDVKPCDLELVADTCPNAAIEEEFDNKHTGLIFMSYEGGFIALLSDDFASVG